MRLFEVVLIVVVLAAAVVQMTKYAAEWLIPLTLLAIVVATWHAIHEGTHWQMFPALTGLLLLILWLLLPISLRTNYQPVRTPVAVTVICLTLISFGFMVLFPMFTLPRPTGSYPVGTRIIYLKDPNRVEDASAAPPGTPRELMVQIWYPAAPSSNPIAAYERNSETSLASSYRSVLWTNSRRNAPVATQGGPFSVLLFNHAWSGRRTQDTFLTEELASHGYIVASIDHTYNSSRVALPGDRIISYNDGDDLLNTSLHTAKEVLDAWNKELTKWVADDVFVLNSLQTYNLDRSSPWFGHLNTERAGALGHSFGGAASIQVCSVDARIQAGLNMDGWTFGDINLRAANQPTMFLYGISETAPATDPNPATPAERAEAELNTVDRAEVAKTLEQYGGYKLSIANTSHMDFTDHPLVSPWRQWTRPNHILPSRIQTIVRAYVLAFFDQTIRGEMPPLLQPGTPSPFHEVQMEQWAPVVRTSSAGKP